jgi:phenylalanyl-tRNA synthetase beta chain
VHILGGLDIFIKEDLGDTLRLEVPFYRVDVQREIDVIEEVLRIYGYNNIELPSQYKVSVISKDGLDHEVLLNKVSDHLTSMGFMEAKSNSLTTSSYYQQSETWPVNQSVRIKNPLSNDLDVLRQTLLFDALETVRHNQNRQTTDLKFYEFGKVYRQNEGKTTENSKLSVALVGRRFPEAWSTVDEKVGFQDIKGMVESLFRLLNISENDIQISDRISGEYSYGMAFMHAGKEIAQLGLVAKNHTTRFDIRNDVFFAEIDWTLLKNLAGSQRIKYLPVPKYPQMRRDLSLLLNTSISFEQIKDLAQNLDRKLLQKVSLFDVYEGKNLEHAKKSYGVSFVFQHPDKTLTDQQVDKTMKRIIAELHEKLGAELR